VLEWRLSADIGLAAEDFSWQQAGEEFTMEFTASVGSVHLCTSSELPGR